MSQPVLFTFEYPPIGGGISRLCSKIVEHSLLSGSLRFRVLAGGEDWPLATRPLREGMALGRLSTLRGVPFCLCGIWYPEGLLATVAKMHPRIILAHGSELLPPRRKWRRGLWRRLQKSVLESADLIVANSSFTANLVKRSAPESRVVTLPLGVDADFFSPFPQASAREKLNLPQRFIVTTVARVHRYKGFELVFDAIAGLSPQEREKILYLIAGEGPDMNVLKTRAREMGIEASIQWLGFVEEKSLPILYSASDLFALCSQENLNRREVEGFGLALLEAQACGVPVIGTRAGGIPDAIKENQGGWLIEPGDSLALRKIVQDGIRNPNSLRAQGELARARVVESCTWSHYVRGLEGELRKVGVA